MNEITLPAPRTVTADEIEVVRKTVAAGATDAELKLYLFDCQRQGVHPLDRLIHFTKRGGRYTPVTSIDLMRIRAADTGEYAGNDDAHHKYDDGEDQPRESSVTVWRFVNGQRCGFTATARWAEYSPPAGQDHMWKKMPHTMLGKCAEALALRKGFPRQLHGLYAKEEMDQAGVDGSPLSPTVNEIRAVAEGGSQVGKLPQNSRPGATPEPTPADQTTISAAQGKKLWAVARQHGWKEPDLKAWLIDLWNYDSIKAIKREHFDAILEQLSHHSVKDTQQSV